MGQFVDPSAPFGEVLADVELLGAPVAQMAAQAVELGAVQAALGQPAAEFLEVEEAAAAVQVGKGLTCSLGRGAYDLWGVLGCPPPLPSSRLQRGGPRATQAQ